MKNQPKGGMCATCINALKDCSQLDFSKMPIIQRPNIVKCTEYVRKT